MCDALSLNDCLAESPADELWNLWRELTSQEKYHEAAEVVFALALIRHEQGKSYCALFNFRQAISLLEMVDTRTEVECSCTHRCIAGILMPDFLHEGVVQRYARQCGFEL